MNWGIIGLGNMAKKFAISIKQLENTALVGISSSSFFKRKKFGFKFVDLNEYDFITELQRSILIRQIIKYRINRFIPLKLKTEHHTA